MQQSDLEKLQRQRDELVAMVRSQRRAAPDAKPAAAATVARRTSAQHPALAAPSGRTLPRPMPRTRAPALAPAHRSRPPVVAPAPTTETVPVAASTARPVVIGVTVRQLCMFIAMTMVVSILSTEFIIMRRTLFDKSAAETAAAHAQASVTQGRESPKGLSRRAQRSRGSNDAAAAAASAAMQQQFIELLRSASANGNAAASVTKGQVGQPREVKTAAADDPIAHDPSAWRAAVAHAEWSNGAVVQLSSHGIRYSEQGASSLLRPGGRSTLRRRAPRWWNASDEGGTVTPLDVLARFKAAAVPSQPRLIEVAVDSALDVARAMLMGGGGEWRPLFLLVRFSSCVPPPIRVHFPFNPSSPVATIDEVATGWSRKCAEGAGFPHSSIMAWQDVLRPFHEGYCPVAIKAERALFSLCTLHPRAHDLAEKRPFATQWEHARDKGFACAYLESATTSANNAALDDAASTASSRSSPRVMSLDGARGSAELEAATHVSEWLDDSAPVAERMEKIRSAARDYYLAKTSPSSIIVSDTLNTMHLHENGRDVVDSQGKELTVSIFTEKDAHTKLAYARCPERRSGGSKAKKSGEMMYKGGLSALVETWKLREKQRDVDMRRGEGKGEESRLLKAAGTII